LVSLSSVTRTAVAGVLFACALGTTAGAIAAPHASDARGTPLLTGGVGEEERAAMRREAAPYNLWLVFVERDTGQYVADVKVSILDGNAAPVVDTVTDGPWLLARLQPGRYTVRTASGQEVPVTVSDAGHAMTILRLPPQP
jgi:hypothetical protein